MAGHGKRFGLGALSVLGAALAAGALALFGLRRRHDHPTADPQSLDQVAPPSPVTAEIGAATVAPREAAAPTTENHLDAGTAAGVEAGGRGEHGHVPSPSIWPLVLAAGVTLVGFGLVSSGLFSLVGVLLMVRALAGWIQELRHE